VRTLSTLVDVYTTCETGVIAAVAIGHKTIFRKCDRGFYDERNLALLESNDALVYNLSGVSWSVFAGGSVRVVIIRGRTYGITGCRVHELFVANICA
jgi:hypothetical protein